MLKSTERPDFGSSQPLVQVCLLHRIWDFRFHRCIQRSHFNEYKLLLCSTLCLKRHCTVYCPISVFCFVLFFGLFIYLFIYLRSWGLNLLLWGRRFKGGAMFPALFHSGFFGAKVSLFAKARQDSNSPILNFPSSLGCSNDRHCATTPRLTWNSDPPDLSLLYSKDYRHETQALS
jgi:hypothetical protein